MKRIYTTLPSYKYDKFYKHLNSFCAHGLNCPVLHWIATQSAPVCKYQKRNLKVRKEATGFYIVYCETFSYTRFRFDQ